MTEFTSRLDRAWRHVNPAICPACKNSGGQKVIVWDKAEDCERPEPQPCPRCGRYARHVKYIILSSAADDASCDTNNPEIQR